MILLYKGCKYREASACPVRSRMYGGIPTGGGFGSNTEWEIGAQRAAEAAHCILGSLGRHVYGKFDWIKTLKTEQAHIEEEMGIINMIMKEYSKSLYTDRLSDPTHYEPESVAATVNSVRAAGPELARRAEEMRLLWAEQEVPETIHSAANWTYRFLVELGRAMANATTDWPDRPVGNPYVASQLKTAVAGLNEAIGKMYEGVEPDSPDPVDEPEQYLPSAEQDLKQKPGESKIDHIMRLLGADTGSSIVYRGCKYKEAAPSSAQNARRSAGTTSLKEEHARRNQTARDSSKGNGAAPRRIHSGGDAVGQTDRPNTGTTRQPDRDGGGTDRTATKPSERTGNQMIKRNPKLLRALRTAQEPEPESEEPSESEMVEQLEEDPGANWRDLYLQPIIRAIRNRFDLDRRTVTLLGPTKKVPFGSDSLGFNITGHVRFKDFVPPEDQYGKAPYRFTATVDPDGELQLPVEVTGNE